MPAAAMTPLRAAAHLSIRLRIKATMIHDVGKMAGVVNAGKEFLENMLDWPRSLTLGTAKHADVGVRAWRLSRSASRTNGAGIPAKGYWAVECQPLPTLVFGGIPDRACPDRVGLPSTPVVS